MENRNTINAMTIKEYCRKYPLLEKIIAYEEVLWLNPGCTKKVSQPAGGPGTQAIQEAADRLERFRPYIASVFPETRPKKGLIESPLRPIPAMEMALLKEAHLQTNGQSNFCQAQYQCGLNRQPRPQHRHYWC
jgi:D-serine dehydratase